MKPTPTLLVISSLAWLGCAKVLGFPDEYTLAEGAGGATPTSGGSSSSSGGAEAATEPFVELAVGSRHACVLDSAGRVACFGAGPALAAPAGQFDQVRSGVDASCALRSGQVTCWGNGLGSGSPSETDYVDLAVGSGYACGISGSDKMVSCWGDSPSPELPGGDYLGLSALSDMVCGRQADGVVCARSGELTAPAPSSGSFRSIHLFSGGYCALSAQGRAECKSASPIDLESFLPSEPMLDLAANGQGLCIILNSGRLACDGDDPLFQRAPASGNYKDIGIGNGYACALHTEGRLSCFGTGPAADGL